MCWRDGVLKSFSAVLKWPTVVHKKATMVVVVVDVPQKTCSLQIRDMRWCGVLVFSQLIQKRCVNEYVIQYAGVSNQLKYSCVDVEYWLDFLYSFHRWVPTPLGSSPLCVSILHSYPKLMSPQSVSHLS
jgi:hypothetical protein